MNGRRFFLHEFFLLCSCLLFTAAAPPDPGISVKAEVNKAFITIGDPVEYSVTVRHPESVQILSTIEAPPADIFKIQKIEEINRKEGNTVVTGRKFTLTAFRLGEFILDPIKIQYRVGDGEIKTIETNRIFLTVQSVAGQEEKTDIRGIKPVVAIKGSVVGMILTILLVLLLIGGSVIFQLMRRPPAVPVPVESPLTAEQEAFMKLNQLFDSDLLRRGKVKEYYLQLSEIIRIYLERRLQVLAVESTTFEIMRTLRQKDLSSALLETIEEVLESSDLAKFAKWKPEPPQIIRLNQKAKQIVEMAAPKEEPSHGV